MAFDPFFRTHQELSIPRNVDNLEFLQPTQCAYANDLDIVSSSFGELMFALPPALLQLELS